MKYLLIAFPAPGVWVLAQTGGSGGWDVGTALGQIGVGALIAAPAYWYAIRAERRASGAEAKAEAQLLAAVARERELGATALPIIEQAARVLQGVQQGMASQVQAGRPELDTVTRQLQSLLDQLGARGKE